MIGAMPSLIYHIASARDWHDALPAGEYRMSTRGRTLADEGFIHCSRASQVAPVANRFYTGVTGLVLLAIDPRRLRSELRYETVPGGDEAFPHLYGPLDTDAVVHVTPFEPGAGGTFTFDG
jgi:glutathione S-transferase